MLCGFERGARLNWCAACRICTADETSLAISWFPHPLLKVDIGIKKRGEARFLSRKEKKNYALFHWAVCIQDECFLCMSLLVYHPLVSFTFSVIPKTSTAVFWRVSYCPAYLCGVSIIWDSSFSSGCPIAHVYLVSPVVSLKGSKLPLTVFSYWICICLFTGGWGVQV